MTPQEIKTTKITKHLIKKILTKHVQHTNLWGTCSSPNITVNIVKYSEMQRFPLQYSNSQSVVLTQGIINFSYSVVYWTPLSGPPPGTTLNAIPVTSFHWKVAWNWLLRYFFFIMGLLPYHPFSIPAQASDSSQVWSLSFPRPLHLAEVQSSEIALEGTSWRHGCRVREFWKAGYCMFCRYGKPFGSKAFWTKSRKPWGN